MWGLLRRPITSAGVLIAQVLHSAHRDDLPSLPNQDPSQLTGDPAAPPLRLVVLGDSSITSPGVEPLDASWPRRLAQHLSDRFRVELISLAVGGAKARDVLRSQLDVATRMDADLALVSVGANDALRATPIERFEAEMDMIVGGLCATSRLVGVSGVGDLGTVTRLPTLARAIARVRGRSIDHAIQRAVARHSGVVKAQAWGGPWTAFETHPELAFAPDQFHGSGYGHAMFAAAMIAVTERLLESPTGRLIESRESRESGT
ncbi:MAG: GDSL-type esterase/lipase family protein [Acidimicrobiia bacterium]|nr:GDSL-type esterase/lipase family protein [Acidimicrobiia bacterium]